MAVFCFTAVAAWSASSDKGGEGIRVRIGDSFPEADCYSVEVFEVGSKAEALELFSKYMKDSDGFVSLEIRRTWKPVKHFDAFSGE